MSQGLSRYFSKRKVKLHLPGLLSTIAFLLTFYERVHSHCLLSLTLSFLSLVCLLTLIIRFTNHRPAQKLFRINIKSLEKTIDKKAISVLALSAVTCLCLGFSIAQLTLSVIAHLDTNLISQLSLDEATYFIAVLSIALGFSLLQQSQSPPLKEKIQRKKQSSSYLQELLYRLSRFAQTQFSFYFFALIILCLYLQLPPPESLLKHGEVSMLATCGVIVLVQRVLPEKAIQLPIFLLLVLMGLFSFFYLFHPFDKSDLWIELIVTQRLTVPPFQFDQFFTADDLMLGLSIGLVLPSLYLIKYSLKLQFMPLIYALGSLAGLSLTMKTPILSVSLTPVILYLVFFVSHRKTSSYFTNTGAVYLTTTVHSKRWFLQVMTMPFSFIMALYIFNKSLFYTLPVVITSTLIALSLVVQLIQRLFAELTFALTKDNTLQKNNIKQ